MWFAGASNPRAHRRTIWSRDVVVQPERRRIGMVFQDHALWRHMTMEGNRTFGLQVWIVIITAWVKDAGGAGLMGAALLLLGCLVILTLSLRRMVK
ncbi:MAG: hypothetical protein KGH84_14790 [Paracoccaceae bacterium]|nr:hypothetical protein [Paracoccaceae bacterium]